MSLTFDTYLDDPRSLGMESVAPLAGLVAQYPYCAAFRMLYAATLAHIGDPQAATALRTAAAYAPDPLRLFLLLSRDDDGWVALWHRIQQNRRTRRRADDDFFLIDRFLEQQCLPAARVPLYDATVALAGLADATATVGDDPESPNAEAHGDGAFVSPDEQDALIDSFIEAERNGTLFVPPVAQEDDLAADATAGERDDRPLLTETLAKVYVKQHKYEQALAIIRDLCLKYPKKSLYFADQIQFLEKVIHSQSDKNNS